MKTLKLEFSGDSSLVYVYLFSNNIVEKLEELEVGEYDFIDFVSANATRELVVGDGLDLDNNVTALVELDSEVIYDDVITYFSSDATELNDIAKDFDAEIDDASIAFHDTLSLNCSNASELIEGAEHYFPNESKYIFCAIEKVDCNSAKGFAEFEVEDDFKLSDIRPVVADIDSGDSNSLMQLVYCETGLEHQLIGLTYKGVHYEIDSGENEGGWNEVSFYQKSSDGWEYADEVHELIEELDSF